MASASRVAIAASNRASIVGRGVRSHPALAPRRGSGWNGRESRCGWLGRQLVEAGERLVIVVGVEHLDASGEALGIEDPQDEERTLEVAATGPVAALLTQTDEQRIAFAGRRCRRWARRRSSTVSSHL